MTQDKASDLAAEVKRLVQLYANNCAAMAIAMEEPRRGDGSASEPCRLAREQFEQFVAIIDRLAALAASSASPESRTAEALARLDGWTAGVQWALDGGFRAPAGQEQSPQGHEDRPLVQELVAAHDDCENEAFAVVLLEQWHDHETKVRQKWERLEVAWAEAKGVVAALSAAPEVPVVWVPYCHTDADNGVQGEYRFDEWDEKPFTVSDPTHWACVPLYAAALAVQPLPLLDQSADSSGATPAGSGSAASRPEPQSVSALRAPIPGAEVDLRMPCPDCGEDHGDKGGL